MALDMETEIRDLKRRVSLLEEDAGGSHKVIMKIFEVSMESRDRLDKVENRLDKVEHRLGKVEYELGQVKVDVRALREELPGIVAAAVREGMKRD